MIISDTTTITDSIQLVISPALYQAGLNIVEGSIYKLSVESEITKGVLEIYQGSQLIYSSAIIFLGNLDSFYETIITIDHPYIYLDTGVSLSPSISHSVSPSNSPT